MKQPPQAFHRLLTQRGTKTDAPITIYHRDSIYLAYKVIKSQHIWSEDGQGQANFHTSRFGGGSECQQEITLIFEWTGPVEFKADSSKRNPNTLYWEPWGDSEALWSLTLGIGTTDGLKLVGISDVQISDSDPERAEKIYVLSQLAKLLVNNIEISNPEPSERKFTQVPTQGRFNRFMEKHFP